MHTYARIWLRSRLAPVRSRLGERGASAVEYGLLVAGIAALIVAVVFLLGENIRDAFTDTNEEIQRDRSTPGGDDSD